MNVGEDRSLRRRVRKRLLVGVAVIGLVFGASSAPPAVAPAYAQSTPLFSLEKRDGYARMRFAFKSLPKYNVKATDSVLVITFDTPISLGEELKTLDGKGVVVAGRLDPDGKAVRFALATRQKINSIEAGEELFIDMLPVDWEGPAPGLPADVLAELNRRARLAEEAARRDAQLKEAQDRNRRVNVRVGQYETFSRVMFDWPSPTKARLTRDGNRVQVSFDKIAKPMMGRLLSDPPRLIEGASSEVTGDGLTVTLIIDETIDVRAFMEGNSYIVDVSGNEDTPSLTNLIQKIVGDDPAEKDKPERKQTVELKGTPDSGDAAGDGSGPPDGKAAAAETGVPARKADAEPSAKESLAAGEKEAPAAGGNSQSNDAPSKPASNGSTDLSEMDADLSRAIEEGRMTLETPTIVIRELALDRDGLDAADPAAIAGGGAVPAPSAVVSGSEKKAKPVKMQSEADTASMGGADGGDGDVIASAVDVTKRNLSAEKSDQLAAGTIVFPFSKPVPAAGFVRSDALWLVFDTDQDVDWSRLGAASDRSVRPTVLDTPEVRVARVPLNTALNVVLVPRGNDWAVTMTDDDGSKDDVVKLVRSERTDGLFKVTATVPGAHAVHWIDDPVVGDRFAAVTALGRISVGGRAQEFVEFATFRTSHGLAIKPYADDLAVRLSGEEVIITRRKGLTLTPVNVVGDSGISSSMDAPAVRGLIDFNRWGQGDPNQFPDRVKELEYGISTLPGFQAVGLRLELSKLYLANQLGAEALGQLELVEESDPDIGGKPVFHAMRAIARILMHRPEEAQKDIHHFGVDTDASMTPWIAEADLQTGKYAEALANYIHGENEIVKYPEEIRNRFRINAARAAIEVEDWQSADFQLRALPGKQLRPVDEANAMLLRGRLLEGLGRTTEALGVYELAIASRDRKVEAEARLYHTGLALKLGTISAEEAIRRYDGATVMWRGDELELKLLRRLAKLYMANRDYRRGMTLMKTAVTSFPGNPMARSIHDEMTSQFRRLYLDGGADELSPVKALGLYYDFRELTPVGRLGDEMIRKLADRLIAVDLLDKAEEVLGHQVEKRLTGAARAQVAAKLGVVYLMNHKPKKALEVLRRSRQAVLPQELKTKRLILEARALSELGLARQAIDLLSDQSGAHVERTRAEAYWKAEIWQQAGEAFERLLLLDIKDEKAPLNRDQMLDVMKAAISYALAEDAFGLERARKQFFERMKKTDLASSFDVVTQPAEHAGVEFRNLAKEIANVDTLESFLADFRKALDEVPVVDGEGEADAQTQAGSS